MSTFFRYLTLCFLLASYNAHAQVISFEKTEDTLNIEAGKTVQHRIGVACKGCHKDKKYRFLIKPLQSNYPDSAFSFQAMPDTFTLEKAKTVDIFLNVAAKDKNNYGKTIGVQLQDLNREKSEENYFLRIDEPKKDDFVPDSSRYRYMIGTNFDFVDGKVPLSFYNHMQFFVPNAFSKRIGFVGGLLQNRLVSQKDTNFSDVLRREGKFFSDSIRIGNYVNVDSNRYRIARADSVKLKQIATTTVFQLYLEPTFRLYANKGKAPTNLYFLLHFDLQYRITNYERSYSYKFIDSITVGRSSLSKYSIVNDGKTTTTDYAFQFYYGAGFMIHHENKYVDLYAKFMMGGAHLAEKYWEGFYACEIGIREPNTNFMLGAEYRGFVSQHNPNYLNVYLSKVFTLAKLYDIIAK